MKTGIFSWFSYPMPIEERLRLIKATGFDAVSLWWGDADKHQQPDAARRIGLEIDNVHAPFPLTNDLWLDHPVGDEYLKALLSCVEDCHQHKIPTVVIHINGAKDDAEITDTGIKRINRLVELAEKTKVRLAFENWIHLRHLDYVFNHIKSEYLGFCYDSGHENFSREGIDCLSKYGDRLFAVHLDDNFGDHDTHLLPFDGTVDWASVKTKLAKCRKLDFLTLEVDFNTKHEKSQIYKELSAEGFLTLAYQRVRNLMGE